MAANSTFYFKSILFISISLFTFNNINLNAAFLNKDDVSENKLDLIPPPPQKNSFDMKRDISAYQQGLKIRNTKRGIQAELDADLSMNAVLKDFSPAFGAELSSKTTPKLHALLENLYADHDVFVVVLKKHYNRKRPFVVYGQATCNQKDEKVLKNTGSFPSGHTVIATTVGLILAEINPKKSSEIMNRAYEYGQSRVICGYHWQSDVDVGRTIGAALFAVLHSKPAFNEQLDIVKQGLQK